MSKLTKTYPAISSKKKYKSDNLDLMIAYNSATLNSDLKKNSLRIKRGDDMSEEFLSDDLSDEEIQKILSSRSSKTIGLIPPDKLWAYANRGDSNIEKILASQAVVAIELIPDDKLRTYASQGDRNIEKILSSHSVAAIDLIPEDKLRAYTSQDSNIDKILSSQSIIAIDLIPEDKLQEYASQGNSNIDKILSSRSSKAIGLIPEDKLRAYASQGDLYIEKILSSHSVRAINLISDMLRAYASHGDRNIEKILSSHSLRSVGLIPENKLRAYASQGDRNIEKILNSHSSKAISLIPKDKLWSYVSLSQPNVDKILSSHSAVAIDLIPENKLRAYASQSDRNIDKILTSRSNKAIESIPEDKLRAYASQGDFNIDKILSSRSIVVIDLISDKLRAYASQGDRNIEKILASQSAAAIESIPEDKLRAYASQSDRNIEKILTSQSVSAIDLISDMLRAYASQSDRNVGKILNSYSVVAIESIPEEKLRAYASHGDRNIEKILSCRLNKVIESIPEDKLRAYASHGDQNIEKILSSRLNKAIELIPEDKLQTYASQSDRNIDKILNSRSNKGIGLIPEDKLRTYASQDNRNIEKILNSRSGRAIELISEDKLRAYASQDNRNIEKIFNSRSNKAIDLIPEDKLRAYASQSDHNVEEILNSRSQKAVYVLWKNGSNSILRRYINANPSITSERIQNLSELFPIEILIKENIVLPEQVKEVDENPPRKRIKPNHWFWIKDKIEENVQSFGPRDCLPGANHHGFQGRRKRAILTSERCHFSWKDVDEFNEGELRDFNQIKINSEKFLAVLERKSLTEEKRVQLLDLAANVPVTGSLQDQINRLVKNQKRLKYLESVGHISKLAISGMMVKNLFRDLFKGNYKDVAINVGFIAGGQGFAKVAEAITIKGSELVVDGQGMLAQSLRYASPFLARGTSVFFVYDLVNQVKEYKKGNPDAVISIIGDSIYLGVDAVEIGVEIAEIGGGLIEGVSAVTGPIGATIGAIVFIGTDVYLAIKQVNHLDVQIHLTSEEKFIETLRAFVGMEPEAHIKNLLEEKELNNQLAQQGLKYLKAHSTIQRYIFATGKWVEDKNSCRTIKHSAPFVCRSTIAMCIATYQEWFVSPLRKEIKCDRKVQIDLDNTVLLDRKRPNIRWMNARPDNLHEGNFFCLPIGDGEALPNSDTYFCKDAIGIEYPYNRTGNHTLISLGEGNDKIVGFPKDNHLVVLGNGHKDIALGEGDDTFILNGDDITGSLQGGRGINTLDLGFFNSINPVTLLLESGSLIYSRKNYERLTIDGIQKLLLRKNKQDSAVVDCDMRYIDTRGGENQHKTDEIIIPDESHFNCTYNLTLIIRSYSVVKNWDNAGHFTYVILAENKGKAVVNLLAESSSHRFVFTYTLYDLRRLERTNNSVSFVFIKDHEFKLGIEKKLTTKSVSYILADFTEIKVGKENLYAVQRTNRTVESIIRDYPKIANHLNMSIFVQSILNNETIVIGHGKHDILSNNPYQRSHLIGNGGENVFVMTSGEERLAKDKLPLPEVVLYDVDNENLIDTLDLREIKNQIYKDLGLKIQAKTNLTANDVFIDLLLINSTEKVLTIRLKDALVTNWHKRLHIILNHALMELDALDLKPLPLEFPPNKNIIVIGAEDVEEYTKLVIPKKLGHYRFARVKNNLVISNGFECDITTTGCYAICLQGFYQTSKLATLSIKFTDQEMVLKDEMERINNAALLDTQIIEYKLALLKKNTPFNATEKKHSRERRKVSEINAEEGLATFSERNSARSSATRINSWINRGFLWAKQLLSWNQQESLSKRFLEEKPIPFKASLPSLEKMNTQHTVVSSSLKSVDYSQINVASTLLLFASLSGIKLKSMPVKEHDPYFDFEPSVFNALQKQF